MANIEELRTKIELIIKPDDFSIFDLKDVLIPITYYVDSPIFIYNVDIVVKIMLEDRNKNSKFDIEDLQLLGQDPLGILSLVSCILLILGCIPGFKLKYDPKLTEELVFKVLAYVLLVILPKSINIPLTFEEKKQILNVALSMYQVIASSQAFKNLVDKIVSYFKTKGWCACMCGAPQVNTDEILAKHLPLAEFELSGHVIRLKDSVVVTRQIEELKKATQKKSDGKKIRL